MSNILSVSGFLIILINFNFFCTPSQYLSQNPSVSPTSKWIKLSAPFGPFQELTFSAYGELFGLQFMGLMRSTDNGRSWTKIKVDAPRDYINLTCVAVTKDNVIMVGAKGNIGDSIILRSSDGGKSWTHTKFTVKGKVEAFSYEVESLTVGSNGDLWAGTNLGKIFRSTDGGQTWAAIGEIPSFETVAALAFGLEGQLYAAVARTGVFRSVDGGRTWAETGFGKNSIDSLVVNQKGHLFAGTLKRGVFRSIDGGQTWTSINLDLPTPNVPALALDKDGYLYAGAWVNGLFRSAYPSIDDRAFVSD